MNSWNTARPYGITVLRVVVGLIFLLHGWQKLTQFTVTGFTGFLSELGIPGAGVAAIIVIALELIGGLALILGLGTRWLGVLFAITMLVALATVHLPNGFFANDNGYEFVLLLGAASVALALTGGGAAALDDLVLNRTRARTAARAS
jgi:putative oxidoreductase